MTLMKLMYEAHIAYLPFPPPLYTTICATMSFASVDKLRCSGLGQAKGMITGFVVITLAAAKGVLLHKEHFILVRTKRFCALEPTIWNIGMWLRKWHI
jgi:hypothetical protein